MAPAPWPIIRTLKGLQLYAGVPLVSLALLESLQMDVDRVSEVAKVWKQMARDLDNPVEVLDGIPAESRRGWIADDQREFSRVTGKMHAGTEVLRDSLDQIGDILDGVANAFRLFKGAMATFSTMVAASSVYGLSMMVLSPVGAVQGRLYLRWLLNAADKVLTVMIGALITYCMGQAAIVAYLITQGQALADMAEPYEQDGWPGARLREVDFATVKIDKSAFPTFQYPEGKQALPDDTKDFKWVAPSRPGTK
ncbi:WXG100 family type VII secretion target [Nonomuraea sp. NPDC004186]